MTYDEQLAEWVKGNPVHMLEPDSCCPDFSCCKPELLSDAETRQRFMDADEETRLGMLMIFLSAALALASEKKVHVAGFEHD